MNAGHIDLRLKMNEGYDGEGETCRMCCGRHSSRKTVKIKLYMSARTTRLVKFDAECF